MATTIALAPATRDRLQTFGHAGATYDDILQALMDQVEKDRFVAQMHAIADDPATVWIDEEDVDWD
ncbi:MAG: hypothetical protein ACPGQL_03395 [Thermoplasmatota archaeon]